MPDLGAIFLPDTSLVEIVIRGTLTYLVLFTFLRLTLNRSTSSIGMTDLLVLVLIADASQNAMAGEYKSWTDGILLVAVIMGWSFAVDWLAHRYPRTLGRWVHPGPVVLISDGQRHQQNLDRLLINDEELATQLRLNGVDGPEQVRLASVEGNGRVSVIRADGESQGAGRGTQDIIG